MASKGYFFVRQWSKSWRLYHESWEAGKRTQRVVDWTEASGYGLTPDMPLDAAKAQIKRLNGIRATQAKLAASKRAVDINSLNKKLFPEPLVEEFRAILVRENELTGAQPRNLELQFTRFGKVQRMCIELRLNPDQYAARAEDIYLWTLRKKLSISYLSKLLSVMNKWGWLWAKQTNHFYQPVKLPKGQIRANIINKQKQKGGTAYESAPLTWELLDKVKHTCPEHYWKWLYITLAFGLRPSEVDLRKIKPGIDKKSGMPYLAVYQSKLVSLEEGRRWKVIPILFEQQQKAVDYLQSGKWKKPHAKTVQKYLGSDYHTYAGRKGFTDWMKDEEQKFDDVSSWLGHQDMKTTYEHYRKRDSIQFTLTNKVVRRK